MTEYQKLKEINSLKLQRNNRDTKKTNLKVPLKSFARSVWSSIPTLGSLGNVKAIPKASKRKRSLYETIPKRVVYKKAFKTTLYDECLNVPYRDKQKYFIKDS